MPSISVLKSDIPAKVIVDPVIHMDSSYTYKIEKPGVENSYIDYVATSTSTSSANITINTQGNNMVLDRKLILKNEMQFVLNGTPPVGSVNLIPPAGIKDIIALRFYPIQNCTSNLNIKINGTSISFSANEIVDALHRYGITRDELEQWASIGPSMHDNVAEYSQGYGQNISVLGDYYTSNSPVPRGAFEAEVVANTPTSATIIFRWAEPLMISPLIYHRVDSKGLGFLGADTQVIFTYNDLSRCLSIDTVHGPTITSIIPSFVNPQIITARWVTPPYQLSVSDPQLYPYEDYQSLLVNETSRAVPAGASDTFTSRVTSFQYVPSKMLIYVREQLSDRTFATTDSYFRIDSINIKFNNKVGILSDADSYDLYLLSVRNGLKMTSFNDWYNHGGSVLMVDFGKDIPLPEGVSVDMLGNYSFYCQIRYTNLSNRTITPAVYIVPIQTGILTLQNLSAGTQLGLVDPGSFTMEDLRDAEVEPIDADLRSDFIEGGSILSSAKKLASGALSAAKKGVGFVKDHKQGIHDALQKAMPYLKEYGGDAARAAAFVAPLLLGLGCDRCEIYDMLHHDAGYTPMELRAAGLSGGELLGGNKPVKSRYHKFY